MGNSHSDVKPAILSLYPMPDPQFHGKERNRREQGTKTQGQKALGFGFFLYPSCSRQPPLLQAAIPSMPSRPIQLGPHLCQCLIEGVSHRLQPLIGTVEAGNLYCKMRKPAIRRRAMPML